MITDPIVMIDVECQPLPRGVGHMRLDIEMTGAPTAANEEFQSTPESQALMRDPSSCKVWLIETELIEVVMTEMCPQAAESTFQVQNVLAERSEPQ